MDELAEAAKRLKGEKAPGLDNITNEMMKSAVDEIPEVVLGTINACLQKEILPDTWKKARLVLIPKPKKTRGEDTSYRPLSLLGVINKLYERLIETRFSSEIEAKGGISQNQYGFRKGKSIVDAAMKVKELAEEANNFSYTHKRFCAMVCFDVKNAFKTVRWNRVVDALKKLDVSGSSEPSAKLSGEQAVDHRGGRYQSGDENGCAAGVNVGHYAMEHILRRRSPTPGSFGSTYRRIRRRSCVGGHGEDE